MIYTILVASIFLLNNKYEEKMEEEKDEWFKVNYKLTQISFYGNKAPYEKTSFPTYFHM